MTVAKGVAHVKRLLAAALLLTYLVAWTVPASAQTAWPELLGNSGHSSYANDPAISTSNAGTFGVRWMANLYSSALGSPVVAYNATLGVNVVYVGDYRADVFAVNAATGQELWSTNLGLNDKIDDTPMVAPDGSVWVGTSYNAAMYKLNGATGAIECSVKAMLPIDGSPMFATPTGGVPTVYWNTIDSNAYQGPTTATNESNCSKIFAFSSYLTPAGSWTTPAYATTAAGEPIVIVGTADFDSTEYAFDANTGKLVWDFPALNPAPHGYDIGAAATISPPGKNGFADGVAYFDSKYGTEYALDLTTGALIWNYQFPRPDGIASNALDGNTLALGYGGGVYSMNATTGTPNWQYGISAGVDSSPAIVGPPSSEVVAFADLTGVFRLLSLASGALLYGYQTGGYITSSPAEANGTIFVSSSDGFLYAYGPGGGNASAPATQITSPSNLAQISNPNGSLVVSGSSTDAAGVKAVEVAIQSGGASGQWFNAATGTYSNNAPVRNEATLASPGSTSTAWSITLPIPPGGGNFTFRANSVNVSNIVDRGTISSVTVMPSLGEPNVTLSSPSVPPGSSFKASSTGFKPGEKVAFTFQGATVATETAGATGNVAATTIKVPASTSFGPATVSLTGETSGKLTSGTVYVTNNWTQLGHDPAHTDMEPNDPTILASLDVTPGSVLRQSWYYQTAGPLNTSPAVVNGVAYVGDDSGLLTAVLVNAGSPQWTYQTPTGKPIRAAPAFDSSNQSILVDSTDGNLYIVNTAGSLITSVAIGGNPTSPVVDDGTAFIGSDNGRVYDLNDATGAVAWTASIGSAVHSTPAYDVTAGLVIFGDDAGAVTAVNSSTGAKVWTASTGGAVTAPPIISNGVVYVGSADKHLYAIAESTGAVNWTYTAAAPITAGASMFKSNEVAFGDQSGVLYLVTTSGSLLYQLSFKGQPIVGVASVEGDTFAETASGFVGMLRLNNSAYIAWSHQTRSTLSTSPVIVDGTVYIGAADGGLYAFTPQGANPLYRGRPSITITDANAWVCTPQ